MPIITAPRRPRSLLGLPRITVSKTLVSPLGMLHVLAALRSPAACQATAALAGVEGDSGKWRQRSPALPCSCLLLRASSGPSASHSIMRAVPAA